MDGMYTVSEVAGKLGIQKCAVYRRVKKGALKGVKQPGGKRIYFRKDYIDALTKA